MQMAAFPGRWIEQVIETAGRIELEAVGARGRDGTIYDRKSGLGSLGSLGIGDADLPRLAIRARADGAGLAQVDEGCAQLLANAAAVLARSHSA
jgi:hypothetical protein